MLGAQVESEKKEDKNPTKEAKVDIVFLLCT